MRRLLHIVLIFSTLASTNGLVVNKHFCLEQLQSVSLFAQAASCMEEPDEAPPCESSEAQIERKSCCSDESDFFQVDQEVPLQSNKLTQFDVAPDTYFLPPAQFLSEAPTFGAVLARLLHYQPPPLVRAIYLDVQTFRC